MTGIHHCEVEISGVCHGEVTPESGLYEPMVKWKMIRYIPL